MWQLAEAVGSHFEVEFGLTTALPTPGEVPGSRSIKTPFIAFLSNQMDERDGMTTRGYFFSVNVTIFAVL